MGDSLRIMEYAIRGPLIVRASEIAKELKEGATKPFQEIISANVGDAHAMGQKPITFVRQVIAAVAMPALLEDENFPSDVKKRARDILSSCRGGTVGSYTDSNGLEIVRRHIAEYIEERDGFPSDKDHIVVSAGASEVIRHVLKLLSFIEKNGKKIGVMVPIPQYPLYAITIAEFEMHQIGYYLNEENNWSVEIPELERALAECRSQGLGTPRVLVVINPGNPTGQVLKKEQIQELIKFAYREKLFILADEVYQKNVYDENSEFHSFKKVLMEMGAPYSSEVELASFMSASKGYVGECGIRGGSAEIVNISSKVRNMFPTVTSALLCPTVMGQVVMDCVVNPPTEKEASYPKFKRESDNILTELALKARLVNEAFTSTPGITCNKVQGSMYAFPRIHIPDKALEAAEKAGRSPDEFYALQLLEATGISIIPASWFGQKQNTYHFRTTILPQTETLKKMLALLKEFQIKFLEIYK